MKNHFSNYAFFLGIYSIYISRVSITDDFVIYTGYTRDELKSKLKPLYKVPGHLIIKWGRYRPNQEPHYDPVLGVKLASDNQYGELIK